MSNEFRTCPNGHCYDPEKYMSCPYCGQETVGFDPGTVGFGDQTVGFEDPGIPVMGGGIGSQTVPLPDDSIAIPGVEKVEPVGTGWFTTGREVKEDPNDLTQTVSLYDLNGEDSEPVKPVVGWLVCTSGADIGKSFNLKAGKNFVGRDANKSDVTISGDKAISRDRHAIIVFDPKSKRFHVQPGESSELYYLNNDVVLQVMELKDRDLLTIGNTDLIFVAFCGEQFAWEDQIK